MHYIKGPDYPTAEILSVFPESVRLMKPAVAHYYPGYCSNRSFG